MYVGRFAPSPTGDLHLGSLYIAIASYLDAKSNQGEWILRMDDVDQHRCSPRFAASIQKTLAAFDLISDRDILYQSNQNETYQNSIHQLKNQKQIFFCTCSRKTLVANAPYPGYCRANTIPPKNREYAIRLRSGSPEINFHDLWSGHHRTCGDQNQDIIIFRRDGFAAYHLATIVDDHQQKVTHVIRGSDILNTTANQIMIQQALGFKQPIYGHLPIVLGQDQKKLSKSDVSHPIQVSDSQFDPMLFLEKCRPWLGLDETNLRHYDHPKHWLKAATKIWQRDKIPRVKGFLFDGQLPSI